jgi:hypothetical protein
MIEQCCASCVEKGGGAVGRGGGGFLQKDKDLLG